MVYSYQLYFNDVEKRVQSQWASAADCKDCGAK